jgi:hypothetical protein
MEIATHSRQAHRFKPAEDLFFWQMFEKFPVIATACAKN